MASVVTNSEDGARFMAEFSEKVARQRIPFDGSIEITKKCNLRCVHCYIEDREVQPSLYARELSTDEWLAIIDEMHQAGCLNLLITGGDPLLRKDFSEIYTYAKRKGFLVTVFTNGTLFTDRIVELFRRLPPLCVEISVYGASAETYQAVADDAKAFARCLKGIETMLELGVNVRLKTVIMRPNEHEYEAIRALAERYGLLFRADAAIFPRFDGDKRPTELRIDAARAVDYELAKKEVVIEWKGFMERMKTIPMDDSVYSCGAGVSGFHVDAYGQMRPCIMPNDVHHQLGAEGGFLKGWNDTLPQIREKRVTSSGYACNSCENRDVCGSCPSFFQLENGDEQSRSEYICSMGHLRHARIKALT